MTDEQVTLAAIRAAIAELPEAAQKRVQACADELRSLVLAHDVFGSFALALVGAEEAAQ